ncbi:hypothetical protein [Streptomyces sp. 6N223]|uniref:hypothetical protein n=1 Tax=Streptomyces sp. 6N223 TaxID=3457412 RepID=UPI003FD11D22
MRRTVRAAVLAGATSLVAASGAVLATPAAADPADCTTGTTSSTSAYAECPAGAGDFEFRVVAQSGGIAGLTTVYGEWKTPAPDVAVRSGVGCEYAPKCAIVSVSIEFR